MVGTIVGGLNLAAFLSTQMELRKFMRYTSVKKMCSFLLLFTILSRQRKTLSLKMRFSSHSGVLRHLNPETASDPTAVNPRKHSARRSKRRIASPPVESIQCSKGNVADRPVHQ